MGPENSRENETSRQAEPKEDRPTLFY